MEVRRERKRRGILPRSSRSIPVLPNSKLTRLITTRPTNRKTKPRATHRWSSASDHFRWRPQQNWPGIEFDYCCCQASFALRELGIESVMVNSNPETVSTDYDTSDLLFFEPLTTEDVLNICDRLQPDGVIVSIRRTDTTQPGPWSRTGRRENHWYKSIDD